MRLLELFSGSGSIGKAFPGEVVSVDLVGDPTHKTDIFDWDFTVYPQGYFSVVWASPPCTQYSPARTTAKTARDLEGADRLVKRAIFLIEYFCPKYFFIENPWRGMLRHREVVASLPSPKKVSYCMYGSPGYQKNTAIWTNADINFNICQGKCGQMVGRRHKGTAQKGPDKGREGHPTCILQSIPPRAS